MEALSMSSKTITRRYALPTSHNGNTGMKHVSVLNDSSIEGENDHGRHRIRPIWRKRWLRNHRFRIATTIQKTFLLIAVLTCTMIPYWVHSQFATTSRQKRALTQLTTDSITSTSVSSSSSSIISLSQHLPVLVNSNDLDYGGRSQRFPSVEERLRIYLSNWYIPPCPNSTNGFIEYNYLDDKTLIAREIVGQNDDKPPALLIINATIQRSRFVFLLHSANMDQCRRDEYCLDTKKYLYPHIPKKTSIPFLLQYGDADLFKAWSPTLSQSEHFPRIPILKKFRYALEASELKRITDTSEATCYDARHGLDDSQQDDHHSRRRPWTRNIRDPHRHPQAIITIVSNYQRHFGPLQHVGENDIPYQQKKNLAIFRGAMTGRNRIADKEKRRRTEYETCLEIPRCRLVLKYSNSTTVDAKLILHPGEKVPISPSIRGTELFAAEPMSMRQLLEYKIMILMEGNDVSTGLKMALYSNSVVMMPRPTCTSWAMEELLIPYVHYVPIADDLSDVEAQVQWVLSHESASIEIARRGRLWMYDLVFHPDAQAENEQVTKETLERYMAHFKYNPRLVDPTAKPKKHTKKDPQTKKKKKKAARKKE
jgi:hypothetical protein